MTQPLPKPKLVVQDGHSVGIGKIQYRPGEEVPEPDAETMAIWNKSGAVKWDPEPAPVPAEAPVAEVPAASEPAPEADAVVLKQLPEKRQK